MDSQDDEGLDVVASWNRDRRIDREWKALDTLASIYNYRSCDRELKALDTLAVAERDILARWCSLR